MLEALTYKTVSYDNSRENFLTVKVIKLFTIVYFWAFISQERRAYCFFLRLGNSVFIVELATSTNYMNFIGYRVSHLICRRSVFVF